MIGWLRNLLAPTSGAADWTVTTGAEGSRPIVVRTRVRAPRGMTAQRYPSSVEMVWRFDGSATNGMPTPQLHALMGECEDVLDALEGPTNGLLGITITGNGRREWVWYVADAAAFSAKVRELLAASGGRFPIELRAE